MLDISSIFELAAYHTINELQVNNLIEALLSKSISIIGAIDCLLSQYIKCNFLGSPVESSHDISILNEKALKSLALDGEYPFELCRCPSALWLAAHFSHTMCGTLTTCKFEYILYSLKCTYLHQNMFGQNRVPSLKNQFDSLIIEEITLHDSDILDFDKFTYLQIASHLAVFYYDYELAEKLKAEAAKLLCVNVTFSAAMGKKTKAQENAVAQLKISFFKENEKCNGCEDIPVETHLPKIIKLEDENLLENIFFMDPINSVRPKLSVAEQAYLLNLCEIHKRSLPNDEITREQCLTFINAVIGQANQNWESDELKGEETYSSSWPVLSEALFKRCLLEIHPLSRAERSLRQFEELSAQYSENRISESNRGLNVFFWTRMPNIWTIELEHAKLLSTIGCIKSALDIYLRWQKWDEVIASYTSLGQRDLAEKCIRERIASGFTTPDLYCCLGDVTSDRSHYETAWELSDHRSSRAMRSLGFVFFRIDKDLEKALVYFERSLDINRFQVDLWFTTGCCCLQLKKFEKAEMAFRTCVQLEPDNFEAWNNLASAVTFCGRKHLALDLLKEATKYNYDSWRLWENILLVSLDLGAFGETIRSYNRLIDLRQKHTDPQVLGILVKAVSENLPDKEGQSSSIYREKLLTLFGRATATNPSDADTWKHYATLLLSDCTLSNMSVFQRAVQCLQKSYQCRLKSVPAGWELVKRSRCEILADIKVLVKMLLTESERSDGSELSTDDKFSEADTIAKSSKSFVFSTISSTRLNLNSLISRLKVAAGNCFDSSTKSELTEDIDELERLRTIISSHVS